MITIGVSPIAQHHHISESITHARSYGVISPEGIYLHVSRFFVRQLTTVTMSKTTTTEQRFCSSSNKIELQGLYAERKAALLPPQNINVQKAE